jgi:diguanylate cyclase (GGDEF)-like protein
MDGNEAVRSEQTSRGWTGAEAAWTVGLFVVSLVLVGTALATMGAAPIADSPGTALFFLLYGIVTISIGYQHPNIGHYSFDRVSQIASILVLGPVAAAIVNGLASLIYPWHRLIKGVPARDVLLASLYNSGLMASIVLIGGLAYQVVGGEIPLIAIGGFMPLALIGLVVTMQALNDLGMLVLLRMGRRDTTGFFQPFSVALELGSGVTAVLVALVFNSMSTAVFVLLLAVLSLGMLALRQFGHMRQQLEQVVAERTRSLEQKTAELEQQAIRDNLTGLFNRRYADDFLERQLDYDRRHGSTSSIALADIDRFKQINDCYSHATGDEVLKRVAELLTSKCRKSDMIARYGGEEFLVFFPETTTAEANAKCEELRLAIARHDWQALGLRTAVTISFGIAESRGGISTRALMDEADVRLYEAKRGGRNLVVA